MQTTSRLTVFLNKLRLAKQALLSKPSPPGPEAVYRCPVCGAANIKMHPISAYYLGNWQKHQTVHNPVFTETMNLAHYMCSRCFCFDRERLYALYMQNDLFLKQVPVHLLDIAPNPALQNFIKKHEWVAYRSMDLMMEGVDDRYDITCMGYPDEQFDFFICSHVLEHIPDDQKAMQELHRVLKKGGKGIVMVPINLLLEDTMEDPGCTDPALRWKYFFQDDHVRMYAKRDFIARLTGAGFTVQQLGMDHFSKQAFEKYAISPTSVLYVVTR